MSRDINIYSPKETIVSLDDIVAQMRIRKVPVEWQEDPLAAILNKSKTPGAWVAGTFIPEGHRDSQIVISTKPLDAKVGQRLVKAYDDVLTESQRDAAQAAKTLYQISVRWTPDKERERVLVHLVDVVAGLSDGVILDTLTNQFYLRAQYQTLNAGFLGPQS